MFKFIIALIILGAAIQYWYISIPLLSIIAMLTVYSNKNKIYQPIRQTEICEPVIPIISIVMLSPNNLPISTKTEAKKAYKNILTKYNIVARQDLSLHADKISQEIEDYSYDLQDNVNFKKEQIRSIKSEIKELNASGSDDVSIEIKELKEELLNTEQYLQKGIIKRDDFKKDKRDFIAKQLNILIHGDEWDVNKTDIKYFIYKDQSGAITARQIINFRSTDEYIEGFCKTREDKRTFRKDRIIENASSLEDLEILYKKYQNNIASEQIR